MALVLADRVQDTTTTAGTGAVTLSGTPPAGYQSFAVIGNGNTTYYTISGGSEWEVGIGTYTSSGTSLSRDTVLASSNGGSLVPFSAGTKIVFVTYPAEKSVNYDAAGNVNINITGNAATATSATSATSATTATNIAGGAAGSIPYQSAAGTTTFLASGTGVIAASGGNPAYTMSPSLTQVTVAADPTTALQVATKQYVDTIATTSVHYHTPVVYKGATAFTVTYNNGSSGVGATLTNAGTLSAFTPDGIVASVGDRILIYQQANGVQNGVYTVTTVGSGSVAWVLTRATDANTYDPISPNGLGGGDAFFVSSGNTGAGETYVCNNVGTITFGTTAITFVQVSDATLYTAGTGLTLTGTQFSLTAPVATNLGGTGLTSFTSGGAVYATSTSALTTGTLPVSAGGTGTTTSTGSGSVVLSSSPVLVTPNLGTPSALTLTNATGLPVATGITGFGTGVATALTANIGSAGSFVVNGGALGTPSSGTLTNATGLPISTGVSGLGTGVATALAVNVGTAGSVVINGGALGTPSSGTLTNATGLPLTTGVTGTLSATNGGTGQSSYAVGDILYASTTTALSKLADVATGNALISGGVGVAPSWGKIGLTTHVSGTLPIANGGTNATATPTAGGVSYGTGTAYAFTSAGTSGQVLTSNGASAPSWSAPAFNPVPILQFTQVVNSNQTLNTGYNGLSVGPVTVQSGYSVTVASGQRWVVI